MTERTLDAAVLAEHDRLRDAHGESHDCDECLTVQRLADMTRLLAHPVSDKAGAGCRHESDGYHCDVHGGTFGRVCDKAATPAPATEASGELDAEYSRQVQRFAEALHETCRLEWQAIGVVDPERQVTQHMADAHYGQAHDLVRRLHPELVRAALDTGEPARRAEPRCTCAGPTEDGGHRAFCQLRRAEPWNDPKG